ncbi:hypothetical protein FHG87_006623 [Trinorchestia longiramus]|nr:hypothetical protein FHG87_006623 [Trinorchestia longiramus]
MKLLALTVVLCGVAVAMAEPRVYRARQSLEVGYDRHGNPQIYAERPERPSYEYLNPSEYVLVSQARPSRPQVISRGRISGRASYSRPSRTGYSRSSYLKG